MQRARRSIWNCAIAGLWASPLVLCLALSGCAAHRSYSLDPYRSSYGRFLRAQLDCRQAGGRVVSPPDDAASGFRCQMEDEAEAETQQASCSNWTLEHKEPGPKYSETWIRCHDPK